MRILIICVVGFSLILSSCKKKKEEEEEKKDDFNRTELLTNMADNIIVPSYVSYKASVCLL